MKTTSGVDWFAFCEVPFKTLRGTTVTGGHCLRGALTSLLVLGALCRTGQTAICGETNSAISQARQAIRDQSPPDRFLLDLATPPGKRDVQVLIPTNGTVHLAFIRSVPSSSNEVVALYVSDFYGEKSGDKLPVRVLPPSLVFNPGQFIAPVALEAPLPRLPDKYVGTLVLTTEGISPIIWRVTFTRAPGNVEHPASLVVVPGKITFTVSRDLLRDWFCDQPPPIAASAILLNTNRSWPLEGLAVVPGEITAGDRESLSFVDQVRFYLNGTYVPGLTQLPPSSQDRQLREISPGGQVELGLGVRNVSVGEYTFELNFKSLNSADDESRQKLTVNLKVRHPVWPAVAVLILGILLSFVTYKWITLYKQRIPLLQRVAALQTDAAWTRLEAAIYPVVWVRMYLRQAEDLAGRFFFTSPSYVTERLDKTEPVIHALNALQKLGAKLSTLPLLMRNRFLFVVDGVLAEMQAEGMSQSAADKARAEFEELYSEITNTNTPSGESPKCTQEKRYWKEVKKAVSGFKSFFNPGDLPPEARSVARVAMDTLWPGDKVPKKLADTNAMYAYEDKYARLWLLYERRKNGDLITKLVRAFGEPLEDYFYIVDKWTWEHIKASAASIAIHPPPIMNDKIAGHAYEPLSFGVAIANEELDRSYLFTHKLRYEWMFHLEPANLFKRTLGSIRRLTLKSPWTTLRPRSDSPSVVQFAPSPGKVTASVQLCYKGETVSVKDKAGVEVQVERSSDVRLLRKLERTELLSLLIAGVFALISGLLTFYYKNLIFGSVQDYLALFIWGAGVDLSKNVIQSIQPSSPSSPIQKPATAPTEGESLSTPKNSPAKQ
jgi:hypothetical protein